MISWLESALLYLLQNKHANIKVERLEYKIVVRRYSEYWDRMDEIVRPLDLSRNSPQS